MSGAGDYFQRNSNGLSLLIFNHVLGNKLDITDSTINMIQHYFCQNVIRKLYGS